MKTTHEVLVAARNLLEAEGWIQHIDCSAEGYCLEGAIGMIACGDPSADVWSDRVLSVELAAMRELAAAAGFSDTYGVAGWNDEDGRTKDQVLDVLDRAIATTAPEPDLAFLAEVRDEVSA